VSEPASTIYTKTGDDGTTGRLFGGRVTKDDLLIEVCGDVDETVAALGVAREALQDNPGLSDLVLDLQRHLFVVAADLSANPSARHRLTPEVSLVVATMTDDLERTIDRMTGRLPLRPVFIVPGVTRASASMDPSCCSRFHGHHRTPHGRAGPRSASATFSCPPVPSRYACTRRSMPPGS
jgi:cob(I)alamin adenosyltransferase